MDESALVDDAITVFLQERRSIVTFTAAMDQDVMRLGTVRHLPLPSSSFLLLASDSDLKHNSQFTGMATNTCRAFLSTVPCVRS